MQDFFNKAAYLYYFLRLNFGDAEIMGKARTFFNKVLKVQFGEIESFLHGFYLENREILDEAVAGHVQLSNLRVYFTFLYAINLACEQYSIIERASYQGMPLNKEAQDKIEIYVTFPSIVYRHGNANDEFATLFPNLLFFVKDKNVFERCEVKNFYFDSFGDSFNIGFIPYPKCSVLFERNHEMLVAKSHETLTSADDLFIRRCEQAVTEQKCEIIFGPEMHGSPALENELEYLCDDDGCKIMICPSYHRMNTEDGKIYNITPVYTWITGHLTRSEYIKKFQARMGEFVEGIDEPRIFRLFVFHIRGFGRIGLFVCRDYLAPEFRTLINRLNFDLVLVSCYSDVTSPFLTQMRLDAAGKHLVILGNSCFAQSSDDKKEAIRPVQYSEHVYNHPKREESCKLIGDPCSAENCTGSECFRVLHVQIEQEKVLLNII